MLSEREVAVERVLNDLRALLIGREETRCFCGKAATQSRAPSKHLAFRDRLARARAYCEGAADSVDRALEEIELMQDALS